jgi:hypothetical protein
MEVDQDTGSHDDILLLRIFGPGNSFGAAFRDLHQLPLREWAVLPQGRLRYLRTLNWLSRLGSRLQ